ncbi:hypothetical protein P3701_18515 [Vibrio parahaemolyticus]|nr:hypothetical protein [Vibrio parahaemolyticus]
MDKLRVNRDPDPLSILALKETPYSLPLLVEAMGVTNVKSSVQTNQTG